MNQLDEILRSRGIAGSPKASPAEPPVMEESAHQMPRSSSGGPRIYYCVQGTTEWLTLRAGIPTASQFDKIITPGGEPSKSAPKYLYKLLAERMMGHPCEEYMSHWMDRGSELEDRAVAFYEFQRDMETVKVGFVTNAEGTIGASPDRLVGDKGLLEIKVPSEAIHVSYLLQTGSAYGEYKVQTQGQLWIAEREWNDLFSYHPEMPEALVRIERDERFIRKLAEEVKTFSLELERLFAICVERGWVKETNEQDQRKPNREQTRAPSISELMKASLLEVESKKQQRG